MNDFQTGFTVASIIFSIPLGYFLIHWINVTRLIKMLKNEGRKKLVPKIDDETKTLIETADSILSKNSNAIDGN